MNKTVNMDIPAAAIRARRNVIREILIGLTSHSLNLYQAEEAIEHLITADAQRNQDAKPV